MRVATPVLKTISLHSEERRVRNRTALSRLEGGCISQQCFQRKASRRWKLATRDVATGTPSGQ
jgi:hypothetical protein